MISSIAYQIILGLPVIVYLGIFTYLSLLATASISIMNRRGIIAVPFKWHPRMAVLTIILGTIHAIFGLSVYFNF